MESDIRKAFENYLGIAEKRIAKHTSELKQKGNLRLLPGENAALKTLVEEVEQKPAFQALLDKTASDFSHHHNEFFIYLTRHQIAGYDAWTAPVQNFFRRSVCYYDLYHGKKINKNSIFETYHNDFKKDQIEVRHLIPMEYVSFTESLMDFGDFRIQQFTEDELEEILHNNPGAGSDL
ncbi:MAG: hypothetical protein HY887_06700 [Deltaproteobacteria bacterium]|nr:hypothetical protein [Deltaproteobacteria bacterium]